MIYDVTSSVITFAIIIAVAAVIGIVSLVLYRRLHPKLKEEEEKTEKDYAKEELDRILQPIEDEETAQQVSDYKEDDE